VSGPNDGGIMVGTSLTPGSYGHAANGQLDLTTARSGESFEGTFSTSYRFEQGSLSVSGEFAWKPGCGGGTGR
jgi:hypothetical protein